MASNNYYHNDYSNPTHTSANANAYHDHDLRNDAPLPPLPYNTSRPTSPFVDGSRQPSAAPYSNDPYDDHNAIPLDDRVWVGAGVRGGGDRVHGGGAVEDPARVGRPGQD